MSFILGCTTKYMHGGFVLAENYNATSKRTKWFCWLAMLFAY